MATPLTADQLLRALRSKGLRVVEHRSWRTHNRNHKGPWGPVHGVMLHHTVSSGTASSVELCYNGHSSLPGPLYHAVIAKDGTVYLIGHGRANHAGMGDDDVHDAVVAEKPLPPDDEANTDGNRSYYGLSFINLGDGKDTYPAAQIDAGAKAAAALVEAHGWSERSVFMHSEWQPGKIDPYGNGFPGADGMRTLVRHAMDEASTGGTAPQKEDDMQLSDAVAIRGWIKDRWPDLADGAISVNTALASGYAHGRAANENTSQILKELRQLTPTGLTEVQIEAIAAEVSRRLVPAVLDALAGRLQS